MLFDYMRKRNPGEPVPDEIEHGPRIGYRDNAKMSDSEEYEDENDIPFVINPVRARMIQKGISAYTNLERYHISSRVNDVIQSEDFMDLGLGNGIAVALHGLEECGFPPRIISKIIGILDEELDDVLSREGKSQPDPNCEICGGTGSDCQSGIIQGCPCDQ
jgi:hypothetical protein